MGLGPWFLTDLAAALKAALSVLPGSVHDPSLRVEPASLRVNLCQS